MFRKIGAFIAVLLLGILLVACGNDTKTITFEVNGGTNLDTVEFAESYKFTDLDKLVTMKPGYTLDGWYTTSTLDEASKVTSDLTKSVTLYAKWLIVEYTITYHLDGGTNAVNNPTKFTILDEVTLESPTKESYIFLGWYIDSNFKTNVEKIEKGITQNIDVYAKWQSESVETVKVTWKNFDGTVLKVDENVEKGSLPVFTGQTPTKPSTAEFTYTFNGWSPEVIHATTDVEYTATFSESKNKYTVNWKNHDGTTLLVSQDVFYGTTPSYTGSTPTKAETQTHTYTFKGWSPVISEVTGNVTYIAVFEEVAKTSSVGQELNIIFGFNIYATIPAILSDDFELMDSSFDVYFGSYVFLYDWEQADVDQYETLLVSNGFVREESENGHYFVYDDKIYIYFDIHEDAFYMDIYMHMDDLGDGGNGGEDEEGLFYEFNVQNTTTSLADSYKNTVNAELKFAGQNPNITITASHVANPSTPPTGLGAYTHIFAADVKDYQNPVTYLEVKTTGQLISSIRFEIHGSSDVTTNITSAKVQVWNGSAWVDLAGSEFKNQISSSLNVITIENINSNQFRLLFTGKGDNKNSGRFAIGNVQLYASSAFQILSWDDLITYFSNKFNLSNLNDLLPMIDEVTDFETNMIGSNYYEVMLARQTIDVDAFMAMYDEALLSLNWVLENGKYVYALSENHALTLDIEVDGELILFTIRKHLLNVPEAEFETLSNMQTVNDLQKSLGDASGLPSMGTFDVLVIPVEINGVPFDMDYLDTLELVFNGTSEETGWESVSSFYAKSSFGLLNLSFDIVEKIETNNGKTYFEDKKDTWDENNGDGYAIKEVLTKADPNIDFSKYDVNDDEYIDSIIFVYSVDYRTESSDLWWAWVYLASQGDAKDIELDGLIFEYYMWVSYAFLEDPLSGEDLPANAETYIHELGHLLGLPDLYPYETSGNGPLSGWDMMDNNNGDHGPFNKLILGWLNPLIGEQDTYRVELDSYSTDLDGKGSVIIIPRSSNAFNDGNAWDEFIMIMFYTPEGLYEGHMNDRFKIRNAGVVIYHVDARLANNPDFWTYFMQDNEGKTNLLVGLLEADKNNSIPGNTSVSQSDILTSGGIDLSTYKWNQGGSINVTIDIESDISNTSSNVSLILNIA